MYFGFAWPKNKENEVTSDGNNEPAEPDKELGYYLTAPLMLPLQTLHTAQNSKCGKSKLQLQTSSKTVRKKMHFEPSMYSCPAVMLMCR